MKSFQDFDSAWSYSVGNGGFVYKDPFDARYYVVAADQIATAAERGWILL